MKVNVQLHSSAASPRKRTAVFTERSHCTHKLIKHKRKFESEGLVRVSTNTSFCDMKLCGLVAKNVSSSSLESFDIGDENGGNL